MIVTTGDVRKDYEILGPVYFQVSNKGMFSSALSKLVKQYEAEITAMKKQGQIGEARADWGLLYGEFSVGQSDFEEGILCCCAGTLMPMRADGRGDPARQMPVMMVTVVAVLLLASPVHGQIDFGDDSGDYAMDGECDDPRFAGSGMYQGDLSVANNHRDATDCRSLYEAGQVCDDPRLSGPGMADTLYLENEGRDAADCRALHEAGEVWWDM